MPEPGRSVGPDEPGQATAAHDLDDRDAPPVVRRGLGDDHAATGEVTGAPRHAGASASRGARGLWRAFLRPSWGQAILAVVLCVVAAAVVTQVRTRQEDSTYSTMRRADLVQLLDQLNAEQSRLDAEVGGLERTRAQLASGADARRVAEEENQKRAEQLGILDGSLPAQGPGVRITIVDPQSKVGPELLLDAVEEMRDAGAEAIQVNQVRVVGSTWFGGQPGALVVDGKAVRAPLVLDVIGDSHALDEAANFRGGLVSQVSAQQVGGKAAVSVLQQVQVTALHAATTPRWARPA